jgi:hypothetical protein
VRSSKASITGIRATTDVASFCFQPEALVVFERLIREHFRLKEAWVARLTEQLPHQLSAVWGVAV